MDIVERIKFLCREYNIKVAHLEQDLGFSNGYVNKIKIETIPYDRLIKIADYLRVSPDFLANGSEFQRILTNDERRLIEYYNRLNRTGRDEAIRRVEEMSEISAYSKDTGRLKSHQNMDA